MPSYAKLWTSMENEVFHSRPHLPTALGKRSGLADSTSEFPTFPQALLRLYFIILKNLFMILFIAPLEQLHKELYTPSFRLR
jgi:hypothetical protein